MITPDWITLIRVIAYMQKFISNVKNRIHSLLPENSC